MVTSTKQSKKLRVKQKPPQRVALTKKTNPKRGITTSWHNRMPPNSYPHPQRDINAIYDDIIRMKKDTLAETRTSYVLPRPEQNHTRLTGVNIDYCCQDYGIDTDKNPHRLKYQSSLSEVYRKMWER